MTIQYKLDKLPPWNSQNGENKSRGLLFFHSSPQQRVFRQQAGVVDADAVAEDFRDHAA